MRRGPRRPRTAEVAVILYEEGEVRPGASPQPQVGGRLLAQAGCTETPQSLHCRIDDMKLRLSWHTTHLVTFLQVTVARRCGMLCDLASTWLSTLAGISLCSGWFVFNATTSARALLSCWVNFFPFCFSLSNNCSSSAYAIGTDPVGRAFSLLLPKILSEIVFFLPSRAVTLV